MLSDLFFDLFAFVMQGIISNALFIIVSVVALAIASRGKSYAWIIIVGAVFSLFTFYGGIAGDLRRQGSFSINEYVSPVLFFLLFLFLFVRACSKAYKRVTENEKHEDTQEK